MPRILIPFLVLGALIAVALVTDRPAPPADLTVANGVDVNTLDPQRMSWMQDLRVARTLFEPLVRHDVLSDEFGIVPGVAESWDISDDGRTYTFRLRADARWSNGEPVTPDDFRFSWRRAMLPDLAADYFTMFMFVEGAQAFYDWRQAALDAYAERPEDGRTAAAAGELWARTVAKFDELVRMDAPDDRTLVVRLEKRVPYFLDLCAFAVFSPVYPGLVEQYERPDAATGRLIRRPGWTKGGVLVSNGAFMLTRWRFKRDMRLEKNPYYWGRDRVAIDSIAIPSIADPNAQVLAYQTGAVDWVADVTAGYRGDMVSDMLAFYGEHRERYDELKTQGLDVFEIARRLPADPRNETHAIASFGTYFWNFNCQPRLADGRANPFHDARVRRAFALVVDKRAIAEEVRRIGEPVASTLIPPGSIGGYEGPAGLPNIGDAATPEARRAIIDRARALLAEAGYPDPEHDFPITVELLFNKDAGHDLIAQTLAKSWHQALGVPVALAQKELKIVKDDMKKKRYVTSRGSWYGDYGDPTTFLDLSRTGDGNNDRGYSNPKYDALLDAASDEADPAKRMAILAEAERMLMEEELPVLPIFHYATVYMFDAQKVTGLSTHPRTEQCMDLIDVLGDGKGPDEPRPMRHGRDELAGAPTP